MKDLITIDNKNMQFPKCSKEHKDLCLQAEKSPSSKFVMCYANTNNSKISKSLPMGKLIDRYFVLPYFENSTLDIQTACVEQLRKNYFNTTVASIPGVKVMPKVIAEFSPEFSQICTAAMITDKKGRHLVMVRKLADGTDQYYLPQAHLQYTPEIYVKNLGNVLVESANDNLNDLISFNRLADSLEPVGMIGGYVVNISETLSTAMHTLFVTTFQVDDFTNYEVRCRNEGDIAMILDLDEVFTATASHMMDPWLTFIFTQLAE